MSTPTLDRPTPDRPTPDRPHPADRVLRPLTPAPSRRRRDVAERAAPLLLGAAAVVVLPALALLVDRDAIGGLGLAGILPVWAWAGIGAAVLACALELTAPDPRTRVLAPLTAILTLLTTGLASVVEPGARIAAAWWHVGFVGAIAPQGIVPAGVDARFSWAGFFSQWAWIVDAAGGPGLDAVLRWTPPVVALIWATAVYALAAGILGGRRAPWAAAWLFLGLNWIEQDYFSPQATAMVLALAVLVVVLGPLATHRVPGTWRAARPDLGRGQVLLLWGIVALASAAIAVSHQLTPFALGAQLVVLVVAGRVWGGRGLVLVLGLAVLTWLVLGGREFWVNQLQLLTGDVGDASGAVNSALADRLVGDPGQLAVKVARVVLALATVALAALGALMAARRSGRRGWWVLLAVALVPAGLVLGQSYGGEVLLRVMLYALPLCAVLGVIPLRALARRRPRAGRTVLTVGMLGLFAVLVVVRGGNDAYVALRPQEVGLVRSLLATAPAGSSVLPLSDQAPNMVARVGEVDQQPRTCTTLAEDPVRCALADGVDVIYALPTVDAQGVVLEGRAPGWTGVDMDRLVATGLYRTTYADGLYRVVTRTDGAAR